MNEYITNLKLATNIQEVCLNPSLSEEATYYHNLLISLLGYEIASLYHPIPTIYEWTLNRNSVKEPNKEDNKSKIILDKFMIPELN